jgi:hypothetical protein
VNKIRAGILCSILKSIVLVGQNLGRVISNALIATNPRLVDDVVITGIGYAMPDTSVAFEAWQQPRLARLQAPGQME